MKKLKITKLTTAVLAIMMLLANSGVAQTVSVPSVYASGRAGNNAVYWKDGEKVQLSNYSFANSIYVSANNDVYVAGYKYDPNYKIKDVAVCWKNGVEQALTDGTNEAKAKSVFVSDSDVYVLGHERVGTSATYIHKYWKNDTAVVLNIEDKNGSFSASSIFVSGNDVYVGGAISYGSDSVKAVYLKNDELVELAVWKFTGSINITTMPRVVSIFVSGNDVYACGADGTSLVYWKNGTAKKISGADVNSIFVSGSDVYVAGSAPYGVLYTQAAYWKNGTMVGFGTGTPNKYSSANSIYVLGNDIYVSGVQSSDFVYWKNGQVVVLGGTQTGNGGCYLFVKSDNSPAPTHIITASAGNGGSILPSGAIEVRNGEDTTFTFTAKSNYKIYQVLVDHINQPEAVITGKYTFTCVTAPHTIAVSFKEKTDIEELEITNHELRIYPNPVKNELKIDNGELTINNVEVFDVLGRMQNAESRMQNGEKEMIINISHLPSGIYFVRVSTELGEVIKKVVKE